MNKFMSVLRAVLLGVAFLAIGFVIGKNREKVLNENKDSNGQTIETVAIVNMDEGVEVDNQKVNYASSFAFLPDETYSLASLSEAESGVKDGIYGAYIVFPTNFSSSVESINSNPEQVSIEYSINPNLNDETRQKVASKVGEYLMLVNDNISKSYVSGIMLDFHEVQDGSKEILKNDKKDLDNILAIEPGKLSTNIEFTQLASAGARPADLDLSSYVNSNKQCADSIQSYYSKVNENVANKMAGAGASADAIKGKIDNLEGKLNDMGNGISNEINDPTLDLITKTKAEAEAARDEFKEDIADEREAQNSADQVYVTAQLNSIQAANQDAVDDYICDLKNWYNSQVKNQATGAPDFPTQFEDCELKTAWDGTGTIDDTTEVGIDLSNVSTGISSQMNTKVNSFANIYGSITTALGNSITATYKNYLQDIKTSLDEIKSTADSAKNEYSNFDPYQGVTGTKPNDAINKIKSNANAMQAEVNKKLAEDNEYVTKIYTASSSNVSTLQANMKNANDTTKKNVENVTNNLKEERTEINRNNEELLSPFSQKLAYTRIGSLENEEAYEFIVTPLIPEEKVLEKKVTEQNTVSTGILILIAGIAIVAYIAVTIISVKSDN